MSKNYTMTETIYAVLDHMSFELHTAFQQAIAQLPDRTRTNVLHLVCILGVPLVVTRVVWCLMRVCAKKRRMGIGGGSGNADNNGGGGGGHNRYVNFNVNVRGQDLVFMMPRRLPPLVISDSGYDGKDKVKDEIEDDVEDDMSIDMGVDSDAHVAFPQSDDSDSEQDDEYAAQHDNDSDDQDLRNNNNKDDDDDLYGSPSPPRRPKP
ncbi:hypothetical protein PTMSG1_07009 [Pyrenophora teres f. maculata]|nr:hypothetical protein PTMSG1_07009 [Pyrenophora teres f. maculata]